jgi:beta-lactam-binding protein with PASTA domain
MSADHDVTATFATVCVVPKVKGKRLAAAKRAIKRADCSVGKVTKAFSAKVKRGRVISQRPTAGSQHPAGAKVRLKVSKGRRH